MNNIPPKWFLESRTILFQLLAIVLAIAGAILEVSGTVHIDQSIIIAATIAVPAITMILRADTSQPLTFSKSKADAAKVRATERDANELGQGLVEYALIIALIAVLLIAGLIALQGQIADTFANIGNAL